MPDLIECRVRTGREMRKVQGHINDLYGQVEVWSKADKPILSAGEKATRGGCWWESG